MTSVSEPRRPRHPLRTSGLGDRGSPARRILSAALGLFAANASAQTPATQPARSSSNPLDAYVASAIRANLTLAQRRLEATRAEVGVREARASYLPSLSLDARYTEHYGNVLDIGDAINPAYAALNQVLQRPAFPTDLELSLPVTQETRFRLVQPVYQPAISAGHRLAKTASRHDETELRGAARTLAAEVRTAYLNLARAARTTELYEATLPLVAENLRVNERLAANGSATADAVFRARADLSEVEQQLAYARERRNAARRHFNLLLNRPLDSPVEMAADSVIERALVGTDSLSLESALAHAASRREELRQAELGVSAADERIRLASASFLPNVALAFDYGVQGSRYRFGSARDFTLATLTLQWNLFNGGRDVARRQQAVLDADIGRTRRDDVARRVALEVQQAHEALAVARTAIGTADARLASAEQSYRLVSRRYSEGLAPLVDLLHARSTLTNAGLNRILTAYDFHLRRVELERAAALLPISAYGREVASVENADDTEKRRR